MQGRFLMTPAPGGRPTPEQRLLAVALADQVGAALATSHPVDQSDRKLAICWPQIRGGRKCPSAPFRARKGMPEDV